MKKTTIAVVILHYNDFEMTRQYIENLRKLKWNDVTHQFIIVDNNSPDGSGVELYEYFKADADTSVILLSENIGFARGNNKGIVFAKDELDADLIVVSNNDIDVKTKDFPRLLIREYAASNFAVYGPDIYSLSKKMHQNPMRQAFAYATLFTYLIWFLSCEASNAKLRYRLKDYVAMFVLFLAYFSFGMMFEPVIGLCLYVAVYVVTIRLFMPDVWNFAFDIVKSLHGKGTVKSK